MKYVVQSLSLALIIGIAAYVLGTRWHPVSGATSPAEQAALSTSYGLAAVGSAAAGAAGSPSPEGYRKVELGSVAYGRADGDVGMSAQKESRPRGPSSFAVGPDGTIYVADDANERVQTFSAAAKHLRSIEVDEPIRDLVLGAGSDLLVLTSQAEVLDFDRTSGQARGRWALEGTPAKALGRLRFVAGALAIESPQQVTYPLATGSGSGLSVLPTAEQERQSSRGGKALSGDFYSTSYRDGGHLYRMNAQGKVVQDVALGLPGALSVVFVDEDRAGDAYAQVESRDESGAVVVEVWRFDRHGTQKAVIPVEPVTYVSMVRSVVVAEDGSVYQAIPAKDSLRLVRWVAP